LGWVSALDLEGRTIWIADAHRSDGKRFIVRAEEKLTAFLEVQPAPRVVASFIEGIAEPITGPIGQRLTDKGPIDLQVASLQNSLPQEDLNLG